jgi:3-hydroxybutyryl-CoA dehydrogenase
MDIKRVGVIGAGVMGGGIAQFFAEHDVPVLLWDGNPDALAKGLAAVQGRLKKSVEKGTLTAARASEIQANLRRAEGLGDFAGVDLAIEAIVEKAEVKCELLKALEKVLGKDSIIGTNTSSLNVGELAVALDHPGRFLGVHFFNPPTRLELVEVVPGVKTDPAVVESVRAFLKACGKSPVTVKDSPGFIVNRLLLLMINEAARMVDEGVATAEDIDTAMRLGALHPAGPLAVADLIGLDTCEAILRILRRDLKESSYEPAAGIAQRVKAGKLGRKSGQGFFGK